jgi:rare lipoprotein A
MVSWYGKAFHGNFTKSGDIFDMNKLTCASNTHKIGTRLKVTNPETKKSVIVIVNDSGGFTKVTLDLSSGAFKRIADLKLGIVKVIIKVLKQ